MKKLFLVVFFSLCFGFSYAQELNTRIQVLAPNVANINKYNLEVLQNIMRDFLNNNKWTNETYTPLERINCTFVIKITSWDGGSVYKAEAQILSTRPVYGSAYATTVLSMTDRDFDFNYVEGQPLDFSDQNFISNLSSLLGYYAYTIIGLDKDSFAKLGGTAFYKKALDVQNLAQTAGNKGWKPSDGLRNRFWLNENLTSNNFKTLRVFIYNYHLNGLDVLQDNVSNGAKKILTFLQDLKELDKQKLGSILPNVYFAGKADEMVNVFNAAQPQDKIKAYNLLSEVDPANMSKYETLKK